MKNLLIMLVLLGLILTGCSGEYENQACSFDGAKVSYDVQGESQPALIFVHGWSCSKEYWKHQAAHFAKKHKVVTIDLAGHGRSGKSRRDYTIEAFGKDVAAVAEKLDLNTVILIGHSMGGPVIVEATRQMPGQVICLVGADTFHDIEKGYSSEEVEKIAIRLKADFVKEAQSFVRNMFPPNANPELVEWVADSMSSVDPEIGINAFRNLGNYDLKNAVEQINVPIYSISADLWPTNLDVNRKYAKSFKLKIMKGIGHFVMLEDPEQFNTLLEETIRALY